MLRIFTVQLNVAYPAGLILSENLKFIVTLSCLLSTMMFFLGIQYNFVEYGICMDLVNHISALPLDDLFLLNEYRKKQFAC